MVKKLLNNKIQDLSATLGLDLPYFISGGFWLTSATIASALGGIFLSSLFARIWPPDVYGQFSFLISALGFMSLTALPGMGQAVLQASAEGKDGVFKEAVKVVFKWSFLGTAILILGSIYFYLRQNPNLSLAILLSAFSFPISSAGSLYNTFLSGKKLFKKVSIFITFSQLFSIIATGVALFLFPSLVVVSLLFFWSTAIINSFLSIATLKEVKNNRKDRKLINLGINLSFWSIISVGADYLDRFLVPLLLGFTNNAVYAFAILIPMQLGNFLKNFLTVGHPKIATIGRKTFKKELFKKAFQFEVLIVIIVISYILLAPTIFYYLYPSYQDKATFLSQIFSVSLIYFPIHLFRLGSLRERDLASIYKTDIIHAIVTFLSLFILLPTLGLFGAVIARLIIRFFQLIFQIYFFNRSFKE